MFVLVFVEACEEVCEVDGAAAYHVPSALVCGEGPGSSSTDECGIYRHDDLPWRTVDKDRIR